MNKNTLFLLLMFILVGCGGEDSTSISEGGTSIPEQGKELTNLSQSLNSITVVKPYQEAEVNLAEYIPLNAKVIDVVNETDDPLCDVTEVSGFGFKVQIDALMLCRYSYSAQLDTAIASVDTRRSALAATTKEQVSDADYKAAITVLTSSSETGLLPPITVTGLSNVYVTIRLKDHLGSHYPTGYILQDNPILSGNGQISSINTNQQTITFLAELAGVSRITYTLKGTNASGEEDLSFGVIEIAVSDSAYSLPKASNFTAGEVETNTIPERIDVSSKISSSHGFDLQLVYVSSLTANVRVKEEDLNNLKNTVFEFTASKPGIHMVTYGISDHHGGYAVGVVQVYVSGLVYSQWSDVINRYNIFTAPLTALEATLLGVKATSLDVKETTYTPSIPMATFNYEDAKNYCESYNGRLPTTKELGYLFTSLKPHRFVNGRWPVSARYYVTYNPGAKPTSNVTKALLDTTYGSEANYQSIVDGGKTSFYVTCVQPLDIDVSQTVFNNGAVANGNDTIHVDFVVPRYFNIAIEDDALAMLRANDVQVTTDTFQYYSESGHRFSFKTTKAGTVPIKITVLGSNNSNVASRHTILVNITFNPDRSTARIVDLKATRDSQPAGEPYLNNAISLVVVDEYSNRIPNMKMVVTGGSGKADFYAVSPNIATDEFGRLIDYNIGLKRLSDDKVVQTSAMEIRPESSLNSQSLLLTNTISHIKLSNGLMIPPATVAQVVAAGKTDYSVFVEPNTGVNYALLNQYDAQDYCSRIDSAYSPGDAYSGYNQGVWNMVEQTDATKIGNATTWGWPSGIYWLNGGMTYNTRNNHVVSLSAEAPLLVPCSHLGA